MAKVTYNERSWAIDVISEISLHLANKSWHFKSAGGESTISNEKSSLFPDVLIFKDQTRNIILQGWELKMPDTPINDAELISNAIKKAKILQRDRDRKSTRLNSSHVKISYAVFCLKKKIF